MSEPREWWIELNEVAPSVHVATPKKVKLSDLQKPHVVHVIDYAAFEEIRKERDRYRAAMEQSIARADDHGDSWCSQPIRAALKEKSE